MKKLIILLFSVVFIGCSKNSLVEEKQSLSNDELKQFLINDSDYSNFIDLKSTFFDELGSRISSLDEETKGRLSSIYGKYTSANDFVENGTPEEIDFYTKELSLENKAVLSLKKVFSKLETYNYSKTDFFATLANGLISTTNTTGASKSSTATKDCKAYAFNIYVRELNYYLGKGLSLDAADHGADIASSWAYVGCVYGSSK